MTLPPIYGTMLAATLSGVAYYTHATNYMCIQISCTFAWENDALIHKAVTLTTCLNENSNAQYKDGNITYVRKIL